jgi:CHAD domain-containing protein
MRICGKRVRYAMELLAGALDHSFRRELYPTFAEVQEKLGTINDHATAIARYRDCS